MIDASKKKMKNGKGTLIGNKRKELESHNNDPDPSSFKRLTEEMKNNNHNNVVSNGKSIILLPEKTTTTTTTRNKENEQQFTTANTAMSSSSRPPPTLQSLVSTSLLSTRSEEDEMNGAVSKSILSLSMRHFMNPFVSGNFCYRCDTTSNPDEEITTENDNHDYCMPGMISSLSVEKILQQYIACTKLYGCDGANSGVVTTIRFSLPNLRVSSPFNDADMLALVEILFQHCNDHLQFIKTLDFRSIRKPRRQNGFHSHGIIALSKVLNISKHITCLILDDSTNLGFHSAQVLFQALSKNSVITSLHMKNCRIGKRGALQFVQHILSQNTNTNTKRSSLKKVDLRLNRIGYSGCNAIEKALKNHPNNLDVNLDGNLVLQEVMNSVTHGFGVLLCILGSTLLMNRVKHASFNHKWSCCVYSISLLVLYASSTLFHSFFALNTTRSIFAVLDHCAIYILIAGSYTPFLRIALQHQPFYSTYLLQFLWSCCFGGILVEAKYPTWKYKSKFSLAMYLGMGWTALICYEALQNAIFATNYCDNNSSTNGNCNDAENYAMKLLVLGGVGYTSGVPFFIRDRNLDHSIWHCFVLSGSIFHWLSIYLYIAPMNNPMAIS